MKVMIDTNIIISAALSPSGNAAKAFMKAVLPPYEPVVCDYIVDELHRKFQEKFPRKTTELEAFLYNAMQVNRSNDMRSFSYTKPIHAKRENRCQSRCGRCSTQERWSYTVYDANRKRWKMGERVHHSSL